MILVDSFSLVQTKRMRSSELTGTVDTWAERQAATENAYEGGAIVVDNDLAVQYGPDYYTD